MAVAARGCAAGENEFGLKSVKYNAETRLLELENGFGTQKIEIGANGVWKKGHAVMENDSTSTLDRKASKPLTGVLRSKVVDAQV